MPGDRKFPERPIVGVGAVIVSAGRVVLVKRRFEPLAGRWSLPGGVVELGETLTEAAAREAKEETGLDVEVGPLVEAVDRIHRDDDGRVTYHYVLVDYVCRPVGGELCAGSDAGEVALVGVDQLLEYGLQASTAAVIRRGVELAAVAQGFRPAPQRPTDR